MWQFPHFTPNHAPDWDALTARFDWLADMAAVPQDAEWHGEGDVLTHTKMVAAELFRLPEYQELDEQAQHILFAAALLHDVEKRSTTVTEERDGKTRIISPRHAKKGEHTARQILYCDLAAPFAVREAVAKLVRWHGLPLWAIEKPKPEHAVIAASLHTDTRLLAILAKADALGRICPDTAELLERIALFQALCEENHCWGAPYPFADKHTRYHYLNHPDSTPDYHPYDDFACTIYMMSALPGSGKDTHIAQRFPKLPVLSLDDIRRAHRIDPADKKAAGRVIQLAKEQARQYLRAPRLRLQRHQSYPRAARQMDKLVCRLPRPHLHRLSGSALAAAVAPKQTARTQRPRSRYPPPARQTGNPQLRRSA